jgi:hypothetical protein
MNEETKKQTQKQTMTFRLNGGDSLVTPAGQTKRKNQGRFPMKNALIIALAAVLLPIDSTLADTSKEPTIEQTLTTKTVHPAELSLPGIVIEEFDDIPSKAHRPAEPEDRAGLRSDARSAAGPPGTIAPEGLRLRPGCPTLDHDRSRVFGQRRLIPAPFLASTGRAGWFPQCACGRRSSGKTSDYAS